MSPPKAPSDLSRAELEAEVTALRGEVSELKQLVLGLREETARLKGLKGLPLPASRKMQFYHYVSLAICAP